MPSKDSLANTASKDSLANTASKGSLANTASKGSLANTASKASQVNTTQCTLHSVEHANCSGMKAMSQSKPSQ